MTLGEFKAWLDGFSCSFNVTRCVDPAFDQVEGLAPDAEQWAEILRRLETVQVIDATPRVVTWRDLPPAGAPIQPAPWQAQPYSTTAPPPVAPPSTSILNPLAAGSYIGLRSHPYGSNVQPSLTETASSLDEEDIAALERAVDAGDEETFAAIRKCIAAKKASD